MTCDEARIGLYALLDGELDVGENVEVLAHLEHCSACPQACEADTRLRAMLHDEVSAIAVAPPGLWETITAEICRERAPRPSLSRRRVLQITAAAAAVLVLGVLPFLHSTPSMPFVVEEIMMDHSQSILRAQGPVDVASADPAVIADRLREAIPLPARIPTLQRAGLRLLGGSVCHLRSTRGVRVTYAADQDRTVSFYQLERTVDTSFPRPGAGRVYVGSADAHRSPGAVLWSDAHYLYALVAELPAEHLEQLAAEL